MTLEFGELSKRIQKYTAENPVVVLGTGATIPYGLPSMAALSTHLLESIRHDEVEGWDKFAECLEASRDLEQALHEVALADETVERVVRETWDLVSQRDLQFHESLVTEQPPFPLADLFSYLLRTTLAHVKVVTTNYDRVAEYAANSARAYASTGTTPGWLQRFEPSTVDSERRPKPGFEGQVTILKVHGSLDWFETDAREAVAIPFANRIPANKKPLVVTPGVTKYREVHKDPFRTVMGAADAVLKSARSYVCVGYGFNDEHVQPVLINRVAKEHIPIILITKKLTDATKRAFLNDPPKHFLFLEESDDGTGTVCYDVDHPNGFHLKGKFIWNLIGFNKALLGELGE